jgi:putative peptide zinc metalloprotease protein
MNAKRRGSSLSPSSPIRTSAGDRPHGASTIAPGRVETTWQPAYEQLDHLLFRPRLNPDVVVRRLESYRHGPYYILKSPQSGTYLRLGPREHELLDLMDGQRTITEIAVETFYRHRGLGLAPVAQLTGLLYREGFLVTAPELAPDQPPSPPDRPAARIRRLVARLFRDEITLPGIDAFVTRLWASVGRPLLARPALALYSLVAVCGLLTFLTSHRLQPVNLFAPRSIEMVLLLALFVAVLVFCHELAHALVCKSFGRQVRRGGFALYFGIPIFFVDTTDIWLENRGRRIAVSAAGPVSDLTLGGACSLLAEALPVGAADTVLFLASIAYLAFLFNLVPLLKLDGYYILVDLFEIPMLRPRSFAFVRDNLLGKLCRRERFDREELLFTCYGLLAGLFSVLMFFYAIRLLEMALAGLIDALARGGSWLLAPLALLLLIRLGVPLLLRATKALTHTARFATHTLQMLDDDRPPNLGRSPSIGDHHPLSKQ